MNNNADRHCSRPGINTSHCWNSCRYFCEDIGIAAWTITSVMTIAAIIILLISAFLHAGWNLLGKRNNPTAAAFLVASIVGVFCLAPLVIMYNEAIRYFTLRSWLFVLAAGFCQTTYYVSLAGAYKTGDMSIAYPLARSSPVIVVTIVSLFLGRGDQVSWQCI